VIVLLAGRVAPEGRVGHHDYLAGCTLLADLLRQTPEVLPVAVADGWPDDDRLFDRVQSLVCYGPGGGKQPFLGSAQRVERFQGLADRGVGIVMIHQAASFPPDLSGRATGWLGGVHVRGSSGRGHWRTQHREFPEHPATRGVQPWRIRDGWLNEIRFADGMQGVTPLVWSGRKHRGSSAGGAADVVCWAYERPGGGRSFCFTGLDAHGAWSLTGVRQLVVNGVLWSAGLSVPESGSPCAVESTALQGYLTPRRFPGRKVLRKVLRATRVAVGRRQR
jgi:hypothetical protein